MRQQEVVISAEQEEFLRRSQESFRLGENEDALKWATRAIAADQTNYVGFAYRAQLNDTLRRFDAAVADYTKAHTFNPRNIHLVRLRAQSHFRSGRLVEAIKDWETYRDLEPEPEKTLKMFQLGIAYAVAGRHEDGRVLFSWFNIEDGKDVEAAAWHFLCVALGAAEGEDGIAKARADLLEVSEDKRLPMMQVYGMLEGDLEPADVLAAARAGEPSEPELRQRMFYAHLYTGLYHLAHGREGTARAHLARAGSTWDLQVLRDPTYSYMSDVALVYNLELAKEAEAAMAAEMAGSAEQVWANRMTRTAWVFAAILLVYVIVRFQPRFRTAPVEPTEPVEIEDVADADEAAEEEEKEKSEELVVAGGVEGDEPDLGKDSTTGDD